MQRVEGLTPPAEAAVKSVLAAPKQTLTLRQDEAVSSGFLLQTALMLAVLLGALTLALKWFAKRVHGKSFAVAEKPTRPPMRIIGRINVSSKTRITLLEVDGLRAVLTENQQSSTLQFLPGDVAASAAEPAALESSDGN